MITFVCMYILFMNFILSQDIPVQRLDGSTLENIVQQIVNEGLGLKQFHDKIGIYTSVEITTVKPVEMVGSIKKAIQSKLNARVEQVRQMVNYVKTKHKSFTSNAEYSRCCNNLFGDEFFDSKRKLKVDNSTLCFSLARTSPPDAKIPPSSIMTLFKKIVESAEDVQSIYIATEEGTMFNYPSFDASFQCNEFDPRLRPYYLDTMTSFPKDLVLLVDWTDKTQLSTVQGVNMFSVAVDLVDNILGGFNDRDRVVVIPFGERLITRDFNTINSLSHTCFLRDFAQISDRLKQEIRIYLQSLVPTVEPGLVKLSEEFKKAFDFLQMLDETKRQGILIFISGVLPDERLDVVYKDIDTLSERAVSHTALFYQLGNDPNVTQLFKELQKRITAKTIHETFDDPYSLDVHMYKHFYLNKDQVEVSPPFIDVTSKALTQAISLPIFVDGSKTLYGIAVMDVSVENLYKELYDFKAGRNSYMFAYDYKDRTALYHPYLPKPRNELTPPYVPITFLENIGVLPNITDGVEKTDEILATRIIPTGNPKRYGVITEDISTTYTCTMAEVGPFQLAICMVLEHEDSTIKRIVSPKLKTTGQTTAFFYHRFDFETQEGGEICRSFYRPVYKNKTAVKFAPKAFRYPVDYIQFAETEERIQHYIDVIGGTSKDDVFAAGVVEDILVTSIVHDMWLSGPFQYDLVTYAVWRYIGTKHGVHRVQPAVILDKEFDPTIRPWYQKAIGLRGSAIMTAPYVDVFGAGHIVSIAMAIYETDGTTVFGVMSIDITIQYLYFLMESVFAQDCIRAGLECFLIDDGGFVVTHKSWIETEVVGNIDVENVHIAKLEPEIAGHMMSQGYLSRVPCIDLFTFHEHITYSINIPVDGIEYRENDQIVYKVVVAPVTNVYLIQKSTRRNSLKPDCTCADDNVCVLRMDACECPCSRPPSSSSCITNAQSLSPCTPTDEELLFLVDAPPQSYKASKVHYSDTNFCIEQTCAAKPDLPTCQAISHCRWCTHDSQGNDLLLSYCGQYDHCWMGQVGRSFYIKPVKADDGLIKNPFHLFAVTMSISVVIVVLVVVVRWICDKGKKGGKTANVVFSSAKQEETDHHAEHTMEFTGDRTHAVRMSIASTGAVKTAYNPLTGQTALLVAHKKREKRSSSSDASGQTDFPDTPDEAVVGSSTVSPDKDKKKKKKKDKKDIDVSEVKNFEPNKDSTKSTKDDAQPTVSTGQAAALKGLREADKFANDGPPGSIGSGPADIQDIQEIPQAGYDDRIEDDDLESIQEGVPEDISLGSFQSV